MKFLKISLLGSLLLTLLTTSCAKDEIIPPRATEIEFYNLDSIPDLAIDYNLAHDLANAINNYRTSLNINPLEFDDSLATDLALNHSVYMRQKAVTNHRYFFTRSQKLRDNGAINVAETVAYGYTSAESVVNAWLKSVGHRKVLEGDYNRVGIGVVKDMNRKNYFTVLLFKL